MPYLRFPRWHSCRRCSRLEERPLSERGRIKCPECNERGKHFYLNQVRFVAMCDFGHLQDFPWREWAHRSATPDCNRTLRLKSTGSATLAGQLVGCDCGIRSRPLSAITTAEAGGASSVLSNTLAADGKVFLCQGETPWHGTSEPKGCTRPLRGTLRSASNLYYAQIKSAIYLPRGGEDSPSELVALLEEPPLSTALHLLTRAGGSESPAGLLRSLQPELLRRFSDKQLQLAIDVVQNGQVHGDILEGTGDEDLETQFRRPEYYALQDPREEEQLLVRASAVADYEKDFRQWFRRIMLIDKLRETRALAGFNRVFSEQGDLEERKALLWANAPPAHESWLPAYVVYGEGIFLELNEDRLSGWERSTAAVNRVAPLIGRYAAVQHERRLRDRPLSPRFLLMHTFSHLLMNQLTFECGYGSSALTNCGRNARKKIDSFGLRTLISTAVTIT